MKDVKVNGPDWWDGSVPCGYAEAWASSIAAPIIPLGILIYIIKTNLWAYQCSGLGEGKKKKRTLIR